MHFTIENKFYLHNNMLKNKNNGTVNKDSAVLDDLDFKILSCLQKDGRMSLTVMAEALEVSIGTIFTRLNKLLEEGTINIIGRVDPEKVGFRCYAHIAVFVRPATMKEKVAQKIVKLPEVSFLAMTSGDYDLEVDVMCRDNNHLVNFVDDISKIEGVNQTKTTLYFKVYKYAQPDLNLLK
jgi:Lrp/AsnC family transcriptional regulator for asnA, asnC and gidA